jgi:hypothetical protein
MTKIKHLDQQRNGFSSLTIMVNIPHIELATPNSANAIFSGVVIPRERHSLEFKSISLEKIFRYFSCFQNMTIEIITKNSLLSTKTKLRSKQPIVIGLTKRNTRKHACGVASKD